MDNVPIRELPEVSERRTMPFAPSRPPTTVSPRLDKIPTIGAGRAGEFRLTHTGVEIVAEPGPAVRRYDDRLDLRSNRSGRSTQSGRSIPRSASGPVGTEKPPPWELPSELRRTITNHVYDSTHSFGHQRVENDINPFRAFYELPKWQKSSDEYGHHYRHPQQTFNHSFNNRMPHFLANRTLVDRYRATQNKNFT
jgi:hypothetical protein